VSVMIETGCWLPASVAPLPPPTLVRESAPATRPPPQLAGGIGDALRTAKKAVAPPPRRRRSLVAAAAVAAAVSRDSALRLAAAALPVLEARRTRGSRVTGPSCRLPPAGPRG